MKLFPKFRVATPFCESETTKKNTIKQQIATNTKQKRVNYLFPITRRSRGEKMDKFWLCLRWQINYLMLVSTRVLLISKLLYLLLESFNNINFREKNYLSHSKKPNYFQNLIHKIGQILAITDVCLPQNRKMNVSPKIKCIMALTSYDNIINWSGAFTFLFALVFSYTNLRIFPWGEL